MKKISLVLFTALILFSCTIKVPPPQHIVVEDLYSLDIPVALAPMHDLYPGADLEYGNTFTEVYLVTKHLLEQNNTSKDFQTYVEDALKVYQNKPQYTIAKQENLNINGLPAKMYYLEMQLNQMPMFMIQTLIQGKKANYELISWTTQREKVYDTLELKSIIETFKEIE
ncbi:hypothetical protein ACYSNM_11910 [Myroides sp. LJL116]